MWHFLLRYAFLKLTRLMINHGGMGRDNPLRPVARRSTATAAASGRHVIRVSRSHRQVLTFRVPVTTPAIILLEGLDTRGMGW